MMISEKFRLIMEWDDLRKKMCEAGKNKDMDRLTLLLKRFYEIAEELNKLYCGDKHEQYKQSIRKTG